MQRPVDLKKGSLKTKHSIYVTRLDDDSFKVLIEGTNSMHDVRLLLRAIEKEIRIRRRRAIPLSQSAEV